ncbi:MAG: glycine cleavage system protein H [Bacteroidetes bacterium RIFCSPLOWO2_02_FULL_36_8]|nr:MAG: glycine cleavage system protein H [Bacteroidetes bacterium RIFCSPLOWO2_02_FULL_36_8]OFY71267.1 MAG: glycine cleavage system protein H [Bacteroidetes bacterium RIFCSPLOWO2_12_FULL_37_12]
MSYPSSLKYTKNHEWLLIEGNIGTVGITNFAQSELGDIVFIEIESVGKNIKQDEIFGTVEAVKTVSDLFSPVTGKVLEKNEELSTNPDLVNKDCYGKGWIIKISIDNPTEIDALLSSSQYEEIVAH